MTAPTNGTVTLTCHACGHAHTQADWEYQSGNCHACGAPLEIPNDPKFASWHAGPKSKAATDLDTAAEIAAHAEPHPGPLPDSTPPVATAPAPPAPSEPAPEEQPDVDGVHVPDDIQVDEHGKLKPRRRKK